MKSPSDEATWNHLVPVAGNYRYVGFVDSLWALSFALLGSALIMAGKQVLPFRPVRPPPPGIEACRFISGVLFPNYMP